MGHQSQIQLATFWMGFCICSEPSKKDFQRATGVQELPRNTLKYLEILCLQAFSSIDQPFSTAFLFLRAHEELENLHYLSVENISFLRAACVTEPNIQNPENGNCKYHGWTLPLDFHYAKLDKSSVILISRNGMLVGFDKNLSDCMENCPGKPALHVEEEAASEWGVSSLFSNLCLV